MEKYTCECGITCKNNTDNMLRHFQSATHKYFLETGVKIEYDYDPTYPVGDYRRTLNSRKRAIRKYHMRKRLERRGLLQEINKVIDENEKIAMSFLADKTLSQDVSYQSF
jgi:hypothetical protein